MVGLLCCQAEKETELEQVTAYITQYDTVKSKIGLVQMDAIAAEH